MRGQKGDVDVETARAMVARGESNAAPAAVRQPLAACPTPGCPGQIVENSRAYGCTSWKSRKNPGCGFVIWKREKGHEVSPAEATARIEEARAAAKRTATDAPEVAAPAA